MSERQKLIAKISKTMATMKNHMYYGRTDKAMCLVGGLKKDLLELWKVEK